MKKVKLDLLILIVVLGVLISLQFKVMYTEQKYVKIQDLYLLKNEIKTDKAMIEQYNKSILQKKQELEKYKESDKGQTLIVQDNLKKELVKLQAMLGQFDLIGEGIVIIVTDAERDVNQDENPNDLVVHDVDIRTIVDDLFAAGAEAVSINDNRVLLTKRDIVCNGPTIRVNNKLLSQPFIINAIGDKDYLEAAINAPGTSANYLKDLGIYLEVNPSMNVEVKGYKGDILPNVLREAKETDKQ